MSLRTFRRYSANPDTWQSLRGLLRLLRINPAGNMEMTTILTELPAITGWRCPSP